MTKIQDKPAALWLDPDAMPVALIAIDRDRRIIAANAEAESLLSSSRDGLRGRRLTEILYHDCELFTLLDLANATDGKVSAEGFKLQGPGLGAAAQFVSAERQSDGGLSLALVPGVQNDARMPDAPGLAAFGRILGHEVKNPLAGISGAAQLLNRAATEEQGELLDIIIQESRRIERLVNELSAFELFSSPRSGACNVHEVLDRVIKAEQIAQGKTVDIQRVFDPSLPDLHADADHLHEAFQNLIRNAGEAIRDARAAGRIRVLTRFAIDRRVQHPKAGQSGRMIKVVIEDDGPGIPAEARDTIFNMFQTSKANGSGLGLTVVSQVIAAHDGTIELTSRPGQTRFSVYLPIAG